MENLKYELIEAEKNESGLKFRARALRDFGDVKKGDISGLISNENCISQEGNCWVHDNAEIHDNAKIYDNASLHDNAKIYDNAEMHNNAIMFDESEMHDEAKIHQETKMYNRAKMHGASGLYDESKMHGDAEMFDGAKMYGKARMYGRSKMYDETRMFDYSKMFDYSEMHGTSEIHGHTVISGTHKLEDEILRYPKLYIYISRPILDGSDKVREIKMGCHTRTVEEWQKNFRNNTDEFPIGSDAEAKRLNAINYVLVSLGEDQIQL